MQDLVSIITPCYNGEKYISRFLDSVLSQDYSNIELILIDDGSTDKTAEIIQSYSSDFSSKGYSLTYIFQENQGQACALNKGLKIFKGDYLTWPDSDDMLSDSSISKKVEFLCNYPEYGYVRTDVNIVSEEDVSQVVRRASKTISFHNEKIFDDLIFEKNVIFCPGSYMVKRNSFIDMNPKCKIYESNGGQNWQMLLPVAFKYKCGYINLPLYTYVVRVGSHSRVNSFKEKIKRCSEHEYILLNVLSKLPVDQKKYLKLISDKYNRKKLKLSYKEQDKTWIKFYYYQLKKKNLADKIKFLCLIFDLYWLIRVIKKLHFFYKKLSKLIY